MIYVQQIKAVRLIYFVPKKGIFNNNKLEKKYDEFECAEADLLIKTYQNVRTKLV